MADRGRDLKVGILSDASKFDLSDPADQLEQVGDNAKSMGADVDQATDELKRLAAQGKDAQRELDRLNTEAKGSDLDTLGKDAKDTAAKVDSAFDRIAKSSKSSLTKVDDDAGRARKGLDEFKDEADSTSKEAAASFSDVESGLDAIQEIAANAFAGFGPAGKAAGILAATGMGVLFAGLQSATEKANEAKDRIIGMAQAVSEAGGIMTDSGITDAIRDWGYAIADNKSWWELWQKDNTTNIEQVREKSERLGLTFRDLFRGMSGSDPQAAAASLQEINDKIATTEASMKAATQTGATLARGQVSNEQRHLDALNKTKDALLDKAGMSEEAIRLAALEAEAVGATAKALQDQTEDYNATRDTIAAVGDAAVQSAVDQAKSIDDVIAAQEKALKAQRDFADNTAEVLSEVGQEGVEWAQQFGEQAPKAMQMLADAPKAKQAEIIKQYRESGRIAGSATAAGITSQSSKVAAAGAALHRAADAELDRLGELGIKVGIKGADVDRQAQLAWARADAYFRKHPITLHVAYAPSGTKPVRDVS